MEFGTTENITILPAPEVCVTANTEQVHAEDDPKKKTMFDQCMEYWKEWGSPATFTNEEFWNWLNKTHKDFIDANKIGTLVATLGKVKTFVTHGTVKPNKKHKVEERVVIKEVEVPVKQEKFVPTSTHVFALVDLVTKQPDLLEHLKAVKDVLQVFGSFDNFLVCLEYTKSIIELLDKSRIDPTIFDALKKI